LRSGSGTRALACGDRLAAAASPNARTEARGPAPHLRVGNGYGLQQYLARRPQPAGASHGLLLPSARARHRDRSFRAGLPHRRARPPSGFGHPLGGLIPLCPGRLCFVPAALVGFALRSFLRSKGHPRVSARSRPHTVWPDGAPAARGGGPAHAGPRFPGVAPFERPWRPRAGLAPQPLAAPVGFALSGFSGQRLAGISPGILLHALRSRPRRTDSPAS
jgi:hypothetical protein